MKGRMVVFVKGISQENNNHIQKDVPTSGQYVSFDSLECNWNVKLMPSSLLCVISSVLISTEKYCVHW